MEKPKLIKDDFANLWYVEWFGMRVDFVPHYVDEENKINDPPMINVYKNSPEEPGVTFMVDCVE